jgi:hypothetical protein
MSAQRIRRRWKQHLFRWEVLERHEVVTKGKGRKKWDLGGTYNGTNHRNIVPIEDESCVKRRKDRCDDVKDEL